VQLLVSVRDADEAGVALRAGAHILDAKEPGEGPLAPVRPEVLAAIMQQLPPATPISVALGEPRDVPALVRLLSERRGALTGRPSFVKFVMPTLARDVLAACVAATRVEAPGARVVLAAYADRTEVPLVEVAAVVADAGADGVLLDTAAKDRSLLDVVSGDALAAFVAAGHARGLFVALAGSLRADDLPRVGALGADVAGVRGAACEGGRGGALNPQRVRALRLAAERGPRAHAVPSS
jgi:uncharacterized protein (UPF0264 family)